MRNEFLALLYGGELFLSASSLFALVAALDLSGAFLKRTRLERGAALTALLLFLLGVLSAPPLPLAIALASAAACAAYLFLGFGADARRRRILGGLAMIGALLVVAAELPYYVRTEPRAMPSRVLVIGDSLSSGGFGEREPWPEVLARESKIPVTNFALASATASMAVERQLPDLPPPADHREVLLVMIGGNDMVDGTGAGELAISLDRILTTAGAGGRRATILVEFPLLPGRWAYGAAIRKNARRHRSLLVPRRVLAHVLLQDGNTFDGIHLTQKGHDAMARALREWLWRGR
ncbi:MAG TPA: SGNH/GDSL hydrolase family protein [Thermoanaerobaculia bacterium]|nr:SGNH/GDSL hydrolase family protein [Thermoanaerobaculia bacterium]